jgi:hypothetical protein
MLTHHDGLWGRSAVLDAVAGQLGVDLVGSQCDLRRNLAVSEASDTFTSAD